MVVNYLISSIILPVDKEKVNAMTQSELNQLAGVCEYKVCTGVIHF